MFNKFNWMKGNKISLLNLILSIWFWLWTSKTPQLKSQYNLIYYYVFLISSCKLHEVKKKKQLKQLPSTLASLDEGSECIFSAEVKWFRFYRIINMLEIWRLIKISKIHIFKRNNLSEFSRDQLGISQIFKFWWVIYR